MHHEGTTNDFIFKVDIEAPIVLADGEEELGDIVRVKGGRLSGKSRWEISVTYGPIQFFDFSDPNRETYR